MQRKIQGGLFFKTLDFLNFESLGIPDASQLSHMPHISWKRYAGVFSINLDSSSKGLPPKCFFEGFAKSILSQNVSLL